MNYDLIKQKHLVIYCLLTLLDLEENYRQHLEGIVTSGSISVDGKSATRRSCNISMTADLGSAFLDQEWCLDSKFKVLIGLEDNNTGDIVWFPMGVYSITNFSSNLTTNNLSISIQGKDKMCYLDGTVGGTFEAAREFDVENVVLPDGSIIELKIPIKRIIMELVHDVAGEPYRNIIINDVPDYGKELLSYRGTNSLYFLFKINNENSVEFFNSVLSQDFVVYTKEEVTPVKISEIEKYYQLKPLLKQDATQVYLVQNPTATTPCYYVTKFEYGDTVGYKQVPLVYEAELKGAAGSAATAILDAIKNKLGEFEYFYDLEGRFVFQKKKNYLQGNYSPVTTDSDGKLIYSLLDKYSFEFSDSELETSVSKSPNIANVKNDYVVWGKNKNNNTAIHSRFALDTKPTLYTTIAVGEDDADWLKSNYPEFFPLEAGEYTQTSLSYSDTIVDWRELIYLMQKDYYKYRLLPDFEQRVAEYNPTMADGKTCYELYYADIQGFWRYLYRPEGKEEESVPKIVYDENGWNTQVTTAPESLIFWFDFFEPSGDLLNYSVRAIGDRLLAKDEKDVTAIYHPQVPEVYIIFGKENTEIMEGNFYKIYIPNNLADLFSISNRGVSAFEATYSYFNSNLLEQESVNISCLPIYYLEPNTRIYISTSENLIEGDYIVNSLTIPLSYNGTMSITASKVNPELIY